MLPPVAGVGFGQTSRTYLWPFFSRVNVDGKVQSDFLWMGFSHQGYWCPAWVWSTKEEVQAKKAS
jgi:hypothetical protein